MQIVGYLHGPIEENLRVLLSDMGHFSHLNHMNDCTFRFFLGGGGTRLYSYREFWHLAS
jgi:hypothetical protein